MIIAKTTSGHVTQEYDTKKKQFIWQEFFAGDEVEYQDGHGMVIEGADITDVPYLPFDMVDPSKPVPIGTEARMCEDITQRQYIGIKKYGMTMEANPLSLRQWLQHAYEECLDQAAYLKRAIEEMENEDKAHEP